MSEDLLLIEHPLSPYAQKLRIMLREKGIGFHTRQPEVGNPDNALLRQNPRMEMPVLQIGETSTLYDSTVIMEYLEDVFPNPPMLPRAPLERADVRTIEDVCDTHYEAINWGLIELTYFHRGADISRDLFAVAELDISYMYTWLESRLAGRQWLSGVTFGWADIAAIPHVATSSALGFRPAAESRLATWHDRCCARPSVAQTIGEALAMLPTLEGAWRLLDSGFKRQYRDHRLEWMIRSGGLSVVTNGIASGNVRFTDLAAFTGQ